MIHKSTEHKSTNLHFSLGASPRVRGRGLALLRGEVLAQIGDSRVATLNRHRFYAPDLRPIFLYTVSHPVLPPDKHPRRGNYVPLDSSSPLFTCSQLVVCDTTATPHLSARSAATNITHSKVQDRLHSAVLPPRVIPLAHVRCRLRSRPDIQVHPIRWGALCSLLFSPNG